MKQKTINLAHQLLADLPKADVNELVALLTYYNRIVEVDRARGMKVGTAGPADPALEKEVKAVLEKSAGSQDVYMMTTQNVCKCCGK